jgi:hypothetical protein
MNKAVDVVAAVEPRNGISPELLLSCLIPQDEDGEDSSLPNSVAASSSVVVARYWLAA